MFKRIILSILTNLAIMFIIPLGERIAALKRLT